MCDSIFLQLLHYLNVARHVLQHSIRNAFPAHVTKASEGSRDIAPLILNLETIRRWVVNFRPRSLYPRGRTTVLIEQKKNWVTPRFWTFWRRETSLAYYRDSFSCTRFITSLNEGTQNKHNRTINTGKITHMVQFIKGIRTSYCPARSPVTIPTMLRRITKCYISNICI
jgi:hypothetical protein